MPEQKRPRAPKQLTAAEIMTQINGLPLNEQLTLFNNLKADLVAAKKQAEETIELINGSVK